VFEAIACGVPVVVNRDLIQFNEWISEGINGFMVGLDPIAWADSIKKTMSLERSALLEASNRVHASAATNIIDGEYAKLILNQCKPCSYAVKRCRKMSGRD
jgi:glycosyltransferase involved in cell wall biosynthesis